MDKRELIRDLVLERDTTCFRSFYKLFQVLLEECRERNDFAQLEEVPKIQGEIRLLKYFLKELSPKPDGRTHFDGGFGG